jgi:subtilisin
MPRGVLLVLLLALSGATFGAGPADGQTGAPHSGDLQRVIVQLHTPHAGASASDRSAMEALRADVASGSDAIASVVQQHGGSVLRRYHSVPFVAIEATAETVATLHSSPGVAAVIPDGLSAPADTESNALIGATPTIAAGVDGRGQSIAVLDTGIDATHPFLTGKVVDEACYSATSSCPNGQKTQSGAGAARPCTYAVSACRHGTHVAGIAAGGPAAGVAFTGVAPGAKLIAVQVFSRFENPVCSLFGQSESPCALTLDSDMLAGLEHVSDLAASRKVASVNMSIGGPVHTSPCDNNVLKPAIDNLRAIGVATVIAAGNDSRTDGLAEPGCISSSISVGATTKQDTVASYSNSAPFMKLWAPGSAIVSSVPGGRYASFSGTSMATPHVAGGFAVARELYPTDTVSQLVSRLRNGGRKVTDSRSGLVEPRLDVLASLGAIQVVPGSVTAREGTDLVIPVTLSRTSSLTVTAQYKTLEVSTTAGVDFESRTGTVTFPPGTTRRTVVIPSIEDTTPEPDENMAVSFFAPENAAMGGYWGLGIGRIVDDD